MKGTGGTAASLRVRLLLWAALWISGALVVAGFVLTDLFRAHVEAQIVRGLHDHLRQMAGSLRLARNGEIGPYALERPLTDPAFRKPYGGLYWQVSDRESHALIRSRSLWDTVLDLPPDPVLDGQVDRHDVVGPDGRNLIALELTVRLPRDIQLVRLVVGRDDRALTEPVRDFAVTLAVSLTVLASALITAAYAQVHLGLRPLARIHRALARLRTGGEGQRLDRDFPAEILPLVDDLNALMDHNDQVLERAWTQAGNLAHGIKTPLTVIANECDRLEKAGQGESAEILRQQLATAGHYVDLELARARSAASGAAARAQTPVRVSAEAIKRTLERLFTDRGIAITVDAAPDLLFPGERRDLDEVLGNLMENACKWAKSKVEVAAQTEEGALVITVDDDGPGLAPEERDAVFQRGHRLDEMAPGTGLGLSIVRDIASLNGGSVHLDSSTLGGTRAVLTFPGPTAPSEG